MNHKTFVPLFCIVSLALSLVSCASSEDTQTDKPSATDQAQAVNPYFTGDGGKGMSLTVLAPEGKGLAEDQNYIPALVQGEFMTNFRDYSAINVFDRMNMDKNYEEILSGYYADDAEAGMDLGHLIPTDYFMNGSITKTSTGYAFQIQITKTVDKMLAASYSGTCTIDELDNFTGIRRASLELLEKMGITVTAQARTELSEAAVINHVDAQTALSRGIMAQQRGSEAGALNYYYQAAAFDPSLLEAAGRVSVLAANISSGHIGEDARNDVRWRRDWMARLDEANRFFADYIANSSPSCEIVYSTKMETGKVDYSTETMPFTFPVRLFTTRSYFTALEKSVQAVTNGLAATKRNEDWRLSWPGNFAGSRTVAYDVDFDLVNSGGAVIGSRRVRLDFRWSISGGNRIEVSWPSPGTQQVTINAKVDGITDKLTIQVRAVNGKDPQSANVRISATNEVPPPDNAYQFDRFTGELFGAADNVRNIPASIWGAPVTSIGDNVEIKLLPNVDNLDVIPKWGVVIDRSFLDNGRIGKRKLVVTRIPSVKRIGSRAIMLSSGVLFKPFGKNWKTAMGSISGSSVTTIIIDAGISLERDSFYWADNRYIDIGFTDFYNGNGKKAGIYTLTPPGTFGYQYKWRYSPQ